MEMILERGSKRWMDNIKAKCGYLGGGGKNREEVWVEVEHVQKSRGQKGAWPYRGISRKAVWLECPEPGDV